MPKQKKNEIQFVLNGETGLWERTVKVGDYVFTETKANSLSHEIVITKIHNGSKFYARASFVWISRRNKFTVSSEGEEFAMVVDIKRPGGKNGSRLIGVLFPNRPETQYFKFKDLNTEAGISLEKMIPIEGDFYLKGEIVVSRRYDGKTEEVLSLPLATSRDGKLIPGAMRLCRAFYLKGYTAGHPFVKQFLIRSR